MKGTFMFFLEKSLKISLATVILVFSQVVSADATQKQFNDLPWKNSGVGEIAGQATINISKDLRFLDPIGTEQFNKLVGNLPSPNEYMIQSKTRGWVAFFDFTDSGYVKDDETIDPDALLKELKAGNDAGNEKRKEEKLPLLFLDGWYIAPRYDKQNNRLEWATKIRDEKNEIIINYTTRILGRSGYMSTTLVSEPNSLDGDIADFKTKLKAFEFIPGQKYAEFRDGDKMAAYGLGALVLGGAAAAASKGGFKALWALILGGLAAASAFFKKIFGKNKDA
jgi:uncharacterized membrane-anchored protein